MYLYSSHLNGGFYFHEEYLNHDRRYCDTCGDCDMFYGECFTVKDFFELVQDDIEFYDENYIDDFLEYAVKEGYLCE